MNAFLSLLGGLIALLSAPLRPLLQETPPEPAPGPEAEDDAPDAIEALSDTAESASEAASEFVTWLGSGSRDALIALGLGIAITVLLWLLRWAITRIIHRLPSNDDYSISTIFKRIIARFRLYFMIAIAISLTDHFLSLPDAVSAFAKVLFVLTAVLQVAEWIQEAAVSSIRRQAYRNPGDASTLASAVNILKWFVSVVIWSIALLLILDNVGADVTALLAGLGVGGIAIGLAAQGMFRDLFSSLSIIFDKPFQVGDMVRYDDTWGEVEDIGLKTTRVRSREGEQIIISNTNLLDKEIHNMRRMYRRRMETQFSLVLTTPPERAEMVPGLVAALLKTVEGVEFDRCGLSSIGPHALDFTLSFFSLNPDYNRSMAARSRLLFELLKRLKAEGYTLAYPTQRIFVEGGGGMLEYMPADEAADPA